MTEVCHGFPHFLQANSRILPQSGQDRFLPNPFEINIHLSTYHPMLRILHYGKAALNKQLKGKRNK
jgi:hypothetical protein